MEHLIKGIRHLEDLRDRCKEWTRNDDHGFEYEQCTECGGEPGNDDYGHIEECKTCTLFNNLHLAIDYFNCHQGWLRYHKGIV